MKEILTDQFGRMHNYLRISLTERCNLRCTYCMPENGVTLTQKSHLMTADELLSITGLFVSYGVSKIRLTGGEPLVRKDFDYILRGLAKLPVTLSITTNGVISDRFYDLFRECGLNDVNISLDTLNPEKFYTLTRRSDFQKVYDNILLAEQYGFNTGINIVLLKDQTEQEVIDFIEFTRKHRVKAKFIEFMPFQGNKWDISKILTGKQTLEIIEAHYGDQLVKLEDHPNSTSSSYKREGFEGSFGLINTVTNPFCQGCNRIRMTADGSLKNCLFSDKETPLLQKFRKGEDISELILKAVGSKKAIRAGMDTLEKFSSKEQYEKNRSMITIGG
ncbi:MAG: GTP 3',8-cyclase MoaA [Cyclobacteriaceae bacterium]